MARVLQQAGYRTALVGKWGLGDAGAAEMGLPRKQGFDQFFGYLNQRHAHNHFPDFLWRNEEKVSLPNKVTPVGGDGAGYATEAVAFADDLFADEAIKFVKENRSRPFFLYWSMVIPHANNERARELKNGAHVPDFGPYADKDWPDPDKGQAAMIARIDGYVGRMLATLQELGLAEKTLVIFTSDNGPHDESRHDLARFRPSGPLSGIKRSLTDGGIRVPMIARWPGTIPPGAETDHVAYFGDWMATAAELAGAEVPDGCDSISFVPTLLGQTAKQQRHEFLYWEFHEGGFKQAALYQGRWKGIRSGGPDAPVVLYDLREDIAEKTDVAAEHPDIAAKIGAYLEDGPHRLRRLAARVGIAPPATSRELIAARTPLTPLPRFMRKPGAERTMKKINRRTAIKTHRRRSGRARASTRCDPRTGCRAAIRPRVSRTRITHHRGMVDQASRRVRDGESQPEGQGQSQGEAVAAHAGAADGRAARRGRRLRGLHASRRRAEDDRAALPPEARRGARRAPGIPARRPVDGGRAGGGAVSRLGRAFPHRGMGRHPGRAVPRAARREGDVRGPHPPRSGGQGGDRRRQHVVQLQPHDRPAARDHRQPQARRIPTCSSSRGDQTYRHTEHTAGWIEFGLQFRDVIRDRPDHLHPRRPRRRPRQPLGRERQALAPSRATPTAATAIPSST